MNDARSAGRWIGLMLLAQIVGGPVLNFGLLGPVFQNPPGFLVNAAPHALEVALAVLLGLGLSVASVGIAIAAWPVFREHSERMALWLVVLAAVCLALNAVEYVGLMSMLSLSQMFTTAGAPDVALYTALRGVVAAIRNWSHYHQLLFAGGLMFVLHATLYRFRLVPRALPAFGMAAVLLMLTSITMPFFGRDVVFALLMPLGIANLALATWLLTKGLREERPAA